MKTASTYQARSARRGSAAALAAIALLGIAGAGAAAPPKTSATTSHEPAALPSGPRVAEQPVPVPATPEIVTIHIHYRSHTGALRSAVVIVPADYRDGARPPVPLIISPHGRNLDGETNSHLWGNLPAVGNFVVVNPDGQGNELPRMSWGAPGQIADLARMPEILEQALPWLRIDRSRIYAFGGSMGGQESLLLAARYPELLAGVAAFDSVTDFARQYGNFPRLGCNAQCLAQLGAPLGTLLRKLARRELRGTPATAPAEYAQRSPLTYAQRLAASSVRLQIWWSTTDRIVIDPNRQSGQLLETLRRLGPNARVEGFRGTWIHTAAFRADRRLPLALARFGLMPEQFDQRPAALDYLPVPASS